MKDFYRTLLAGCTFLLLAAGCSAPTAAPTATPAATQTSPPLATIALTALPTPASAPQAQGLPALALAQQVAADLQAAEHPLLDFHRAGIELKGLDPAQLTPQPADPAGLKVDDRKNFVMLANPGVTNRFTSIQARLRHLTEKTAWWVAINSKIDNETVAQIAGRFEEEIMPVNHLIFGQEWKPGIDNDPRLHILLFDEPETWGGIYGYFTFINEYPTAIFPNSNMHEMFYLNLGAVRPDTIAFMGELGHEYHHLIHFNQDPNEDQWLNEGMSELAAFFTGAIEASSILGDSNAETFAAHPEIQLTHRPEISNQLDFAHYAAEKLFFIYLLEQFGPRLIKDIVANPEPGVLSIQQELDKLPGSPRFDDVYANWLVANYLDMPAIADGQFGYKEHNQTTNTFPKPIQVTSFDGAKLEDALAPYGARYYELRSGSPVKVKFSGSPLAQLTAADPPQGQYAWYSNRGDLSEFSLARLFDLSGMEQATLNYKVWYELDKNYDYGYLQVSTDDGRTWAVLDTEHGTDEDPFDQAYGRGYTGESRDWLAESIDLSAYAGKKIWLRFQVLTDFTSNRDGMLLDEITIPELGFFDGAEDDSAGWQARGFIRSTNFVPANWIMWVVTPGPQIERVQIGEDQQVEFTITSLGQTANYGTLIVSPAVPTTTQEVDYELLFER